MQAHVDQGGGMRDNVGVHLPSKTMRISALTEKDKEDLVFGLSSGVDYIAMSFVRRAEDILQIREICNAWGAPTPVVAKIETPDAVENLESIVAASDGVMVARGDLGVEFPPERVPVIQRQILGVARRVRRPVIVATEMLQSMTKSTRPTRAEASDVANAVYSGTDCLMLSGETATGDHPTLACSMMSRIATEAEKSPFFEHSPVRLAGHERRRGHRARGVQHGARDRREVHRRVHRERLERDDREPGAAGRADHRVLAELEDAPQDGALLGRRAARDARDARQRPARRLVHGRPPRRGLRIARASASSSSSARRSASAGARTASASTSSGRAFSARDTDSEKAKRDGGKRGAFTVLYRRVRGYFAGARRRSVRKETNMNRWIARIVTLASLAGAVALVPAGVAYAQQAASRSTRVTTRATAWASSATRSSSTR